MTLIMSCVHTILRGVMRVVSPPATMVMVRALAHFQCAVVIATETLL
jgi:hypothetical protein